MLDDVLKELRAGIEKSFEALRRDLSQKSLGGRAHAGMIDGIRIDYYGVPTPVQQMATVSVPEPRLITIMPWENGQVKAIDKALRDSDLGFNPQIDGNLIRIPIPALKEERRKEMVKLTKKYGEDGKVAIRKHQRDANELIEVLEKDGDIVGDEAERARKKVEEMVAEGVKQIDAVIASKEKDILEI